MHELHNGQLDVSAISGTKRYWKKSKRPEWQRNKLIPCNLCRVGVVDLVGVFDAVPHLFC